MLRQQPGSTRPDTLFPSTKVLTIMPPVRDVGRFSEERQDGGPAGNDDDHQPGRRLPDREQDESGQRQPEITGTADRAGPARFVERRTRPEEHTSELQSLMRSSYADFCLIN